MWARGRPEMGPAVRGRASSGLGWPGGVLGALECFAGLVTAPICSELCVRASRSRRIRSRNAETVITVVCEPT